MGIVASAQMAQDQFLFNQLNDVTKNNFRIEKKALTMNVVATLRDDLRDLCDQQYASLETTMLLSTLVLEFGLGFVVEGTFPHQEIFNSDDWEWYTPLLMIYSGFMALSIMLPFWSIWGSIECTRQLNQFMKRVLEIDPSTRVNVESMLKHYKDFEVFWQEHCQWLHELTMKCFWLGMVTNITAVGILTTLNFWDDYEYDVAWQTFGGIIGFNLLLVFLLYLKSVCRCCCRSGSGSDGGRMSSLRRSLSGGPSSFKEPLLSESQREQWWWLPTFMRPVTQLIDQQSSSLVGRDIPSENSVVENFPNARSPRTPNERPNLVSQFSTDSDLSDSYFNNDIFFGSAETSEDLRNDPTLPPSDVNRFMKKHSSRRNR